MCHSGVSRCQSTPVSLLANQFNVQSVLHGQMSLAAVNQIYVIHEAIWLQKSKGLLNDCFENVNICHCKNRGDRTLWQ